MGEDGIHEALKEKKYISTFGMTSRLESWRKHVPRMLTLLPGRRLEDVSWPWIKVRAGIVTNDEVILEESGAFSWRRRLREETSTAEAHVLCRTPPSSSFGEGLGMGNQFSKTLRKGRSTLRSQQRTLKRFSMFYQIFSAVSQIWNWAPRKHQPLPQPRSLSRSGSG